MHPVLFEIAGRAVPSFGVLVALGFLVAAYGVFPALLRRGGLEPVPARAAAAAIGLAVLVGTFLGARLGYVGVEFAKRWLHGEAASPAAAAIVAEPWLALALWRGGLVMYGGALGALVAGLVAAQRQGIERGTALDAGVVAGAFALSIGRLGCLAVGDDHGALVPVSLSGLPFPLTLRVPDLAWLAAHPESLFDRALAGRLVWATQVWMALFALFLGLVGLRLLRDARRPGSSAAALGMAYAAGRFAIESFRGDELRGVWFGGWLSTSQLVSIPLFVGCAGWLAHSRRDPCER